MFLRGFTFLCVFRSQFSQGEGSKHQAAGTSNAETSSRRGRKNSKKSAAEVASQGSESWVNPKSSRGIPKDAGKRRVHAVGQSGGHWYTGPDGKRVGSLSFYLLTMWLVMLAIRR